MEDVHGERFLGYRHCRVDCKFLPVIDRLIMLLMMNQAYYWVETKGKTLEEIDAIFEGEKHSSVPDVALVRAGQAKVDVGVVEEQLETEVVNAKAD